VSRARILPLVLAGAIALSFIGLRGAGTQTGGLRRVTNTSEEGINLNPSISGDGRILAFESTEDVAHVGGTDHFRAIRANITPDTATFFQMGGARAVAPAISQDGSRIAFASKDDPLGTNPDGNSEIFLFDAAKLIQVTTTSPGDVANRVTNGNFQPSITDDGRFIAFSSNRDLAGQNPDGNLEIFIYDVSAVSFTQLTNSSGIVGFSDAKISGNGDSVAYIRDAGTTPSSKRDLLEQPRAGSGPVTLLASNVQSLAMTYGRAICDDGTRVVFSAETAANSTQVFLFDGRSGPANRQITSLGARATEVPLHPTISGDGSRIAFAARRSVNGTASNSDGSVELYVFDIPSSQVSKITDVPSGVTTDVLSSLNDDGSIAAFNFPRILSGAVSNSDSANNSEIYVTATPARPPFGALTVVNGASFGNEPSSTKAVAPDSIAVAAGGALGNSTQQSQRLANGTFPTNVGGTTVTVNGRAAQIFFVSPGQVNFLVPPLTEIGAADVVITNSENFSSRATVPTLRAAPGVFTRGGDGSGPGVILNSDTLQEGPFDPSSGNLRLTIFTTGARNANQNSVVIGGRVLAAETVIASPDMPGLDEGHVLVPRDLRGAGTVDLFVQSDGRASNPVAVTFIGDATRDILINEMLSDPPGSVATDLQGDANHDGVRSSSNDEFVELVNTTTHDIDIGGYQLLTRSSSATTDTLRHTFAASTIVPACTAVVVFGGGTLEANNSVFGGSMVVKASSGDLSLSNTGGVVTLRDQASGIVSSLPYGGSTGLNGNAGQSLTRAPDKTGNFVLHQTASGSGGRSFSPGTQLNGAPFATCNTFVNIDVSPSLATVDGGAKQQFTAKAINANGDEVPGVIFSWQSSNASVATIDQNGLASSSTAGSTEIRASARGIQSAPAKLTVREIPRVLTRIDVTPQSATIPATGAQQFTAKGIDQFGSEIVGLTLAWESSNTNAATIDQTGLASGISQGQSTIKATSQNVRGTATLDVTAPTVVVNEVLADPPTGTDGDANHDGTRDSAQDEFVELVNSTNGGINVSGWTIRTHSTTSSTETVRHTFVANTTLSAGDAMVVFGGGTFNPANPLFACAQVVKASSGGLPLTNGGLTILVRDGSGNLVTQFSYGGTTGLNGGSAQSLTRSPDITGNFVLHTTPASAGGRKFSSGLKVDGTPFGNCPGHPASVTISPPTTAISVGQSTQLTSQAFDQFGRAMLGVAITFASDDTSAATVDSVTPNASTGIVTANVSAHNPGTAHITASASDGSTTANSSSATLTVNGPSLSINDVSQNEGNSGTTIFTFTVSLSQPAPPGGVTFNVATQDGTATTANDDYVARTLTAQTIRAGQTTYTFDVTVKGDLNIEPNQTFFVNVTNVLGASVDDGQGLGTIINDDTANLVISQVYGGGDNSGAPFRNDFVELYNHGATTVDFSITPYSIQYASVGSNFGANKTNLTAGTIAPGRYFLIQESGGITNGVALSTPDATGTIAMASTAGKVTLVVGTTALATATCPGDDGPSPFNPSSAAVVDFVGYGSSATTAGHCYEGDGPATPPSNTTADFRKAGGCVDTNDDASDFLVASPNPRNSNSPIGDCKPEITINNVTVNEGNSGTVNATFTVTLSAPSGQTVTLNYATADSTATAPADYQSTSGLLSFNPGDLSKTITVPVNGDTLDEPSENFFVNLSNVANAVLLDSQGQGTINDNDPTPSLSINDVSVTEGDSSTTPATFTVTLSAASGQTVAVNYATADNSATAGSDYQPASGTLTFNPGETSKPVTVLVNGDTTFEQSETLFVDLTAPVNASISDNHGQGTITNDDAEPPTPTLFITDVNITEGNSGTTIATFSVTLLPSSSQTVKVDYATANGTATTAGNDYQSASGTLTFDPGDTSKSISVTINGDTLVEPDETFSVNLSNATGGAAIGTPFGTGTIQNDDTANLVISQVYGGGGNSGAPFTNDFIEVFNRGTTTVDLAGWSVQYSSASGTGNWSNTPLCPSGPCLFLPGRYFLVREGANGAANLPTPDATGSIAMATTSGKVALVSSTTALNGACPSSTSITDHVGYGGTAATTDSCFEGAGPAPAPSNTTADFRKAGGCIDTNDNAADFFVFAPNPRNTGSPANNCTAGTPPNMTIDDVTVTEGNSGTATATFTVSLSAPAPSTDVTFDIGTQNGTATTANSDFVSKSLTNQIIPAGQTTYTFSVTVNGDLTIETDETFLANVTNVSGATVTDGQGVGTIQNDDFPALSINDVSQNEGDSGNSTFHFTVSLSAPALTGGVTFDIATQDHTATLADNDYNTHSVTGQTIPAGQQTYGFDVTVNGDLDIEPNETFFVNVTNVSGATIVDGQGAGTIQNDDSPVLSINDVSASEGNNGTTTLTFIVNSTLPAPAGGITFDIATQDNTATVANDDYISRSLTSRTILAMQTTYTFDVTVNGDKLVEPNETFFVNISNPADATIGDGQGVGTITNDDTANLVISQVYGGGNNSGAPYQNDFVEIFNRGTTTVDFSVTPYSVQYAGVGSSFGPNRTNLTTGAIAPGRYFLVQESGGTANGVPLPSPDATGSIAMGNTSGKVALVVGTAALPSFTCPGDDVVSPFNPSDSLIADFVGYGNTATIAGHCYVGAGPATAPSNTTADFRKSGGCTDTDQNATDFLVSGPFPRNTGSPIDTCVAGAPPNLTISDVSVIEGNSGTTTATFTVSLSAPAPSTDISFDIATQNNTASTANSDYVTRSLTNQVVPAGQQTYSFDVTINGDPTVESDETFFVNLTNASGAAILDGQGVGTIQNDDLPILEINDVTVTEGNGGTKLFTFTVGLSAAAPTGGVTFDIATQDISATVADGDYVSRSLTGQTITAGNTSYTFDVTVNGDTNIETDETFFVNVTNITGATLTGGDGQGLGTIQNDDSPSLSINDVTQTEADSGITTFTFTVTSSLPAPAGGITFDIATADGTAQDDTPATEDNDYVARSLTGQTIPATQTAYTFDVTVNGDTKNEAICETFFVNLSNPMNATILDGQGQGGITDNDGTKLVISQVYGGGSNSGAPFRSDFIEIFNRGATTVSLTGWSLQYISAAGTGSWAVTNLSGSVLPGQYYLVQLAGSNVAFTALPTPDATGGTDMSATAGKIALVNSTTALSGSCPSSATIVDLIGYGSTATCREGSTTADNAPAPSNTTADLRKQSGCQDTVINATDFQSLAPAPRNASSTLAPCSCGTSYSSLFILGEESWKSTLARLVATSSLSATGLLRP
jgi:hypothetical protein